MAKSNNRAERLKAGQSLPISYPTQKMRTEIIFILDESGSMQQCSQAAVDGFNEFVQSQKKVDKDTTLTLVKFNDASTVVGTWNICEVPELRNGSTYRPAAMTALCDAVGDGVYAASPSLNSRMLVAILTDGHENASKRFTIRSIRDLIAAKESEGNWTFVYLGTGHDVFKAADKFGISAGNTMSYDNTPYGTTTGIAHMSASAMSYTINAAPRTTTFFTTTDASGLTTKEAAKTLQNVASQFTSHSVASEERIDSFVSRVTRRAYNPGSSFYMLTKPEMVQAYKDVMVQEKGTRNLYGGPDARGLIGMVPGQNNKVKPGNHGNWDIFVQSNSVNRKLVRGTRVLVRK